MESFTNKDLVKPCAIAFWVFAAFLFSLFNGSVASVPSAVHTAVDHYGGDPWLSTVFALYCLDLPRLAYY